MARVFWLRAPQSALPSVVEQAVCPVLDVLAKDLDPAAEATELVELQDSCPFKWGHAGSGRMGWECTTADTNNWQQNTVAVTREGTNLMCCAGRGAYPHCHSMHSTHLKPSEGRISARFR